MIRDTLSGILTGAVRAAAKDLGVDAGDDLLPELTRPKQKQHGDWSTNVALVLAPRAGRPARAVAEAIVDRLDAEHVVSRVEVAGPGFINLFLREDWVAAAVREVLERGSDFARAPKTGERVQVEFVSANPTGPLHVGTARNAAIGDSLANLLESAGHTVEREYYWNDTGKQMELFAASIEARYLELSGRASHVPEEGYHGEYLIDLARRILQERGDGLVGEDPAERRRVLLAEGFDRMLAGIRATLERFRVRFDTWKAESSLKESGEITRAIEILRRRGHVYESEGATWFRSTEFGDEKDRVLIRRSGEPTYFAKDCGYLLDKAARGFDRMVYVLGADHHGDVQRLLGAADALGVGRQRLCIVLYQLVSLYRGGEPVRMSKRSGDLITLDELLDEVGPDAARYTLLSRSSDSPLDFDIEIVTRQSLENPVYYVQYAHARIASLLRVAAERGVELRPWQDTDLTLLKHAAEADLVGVLSELPEVVSTAAASLAPHRLTRFAERVAAAFHRFYTDCRILGEEDGLAQARLWLSKATMSVLAISLALLGVSAPESMDRIGVGDA